MTRAEVARRIGRSIATVRRMEGKELHPEVDWQGVHLFDPEEVEQVAEELKNNGRRRAEYVSDMPDFLMESQLQTIRAENEELRAELKNLRNVDELGAKFVEIAREAVQMVCDNRCRGWQMLQIKYRRAVQAIPD